MAIPPWAAEVLRRGMGNMLEKVPTDTVENLKRRANDLLSDLPQSAARGVDSVMRSARMGKDAVHRWSRRHLALVTPVVNGSGCLINPSVGHLPISEAAAEVSAEAFRFGTLASPVAQQRLQRRLDKCLPQGEFAIAVAASVDGACLAVAQATGDRTLYFHRSQSQRLPSGTPIPDAFASGQGRRVGSIQEIGGVDRVDVSDARQIRHPAAVVLVENGRVDADWLDHSASPNPANSSSGDAANQPLRILYCPIASWNRTFANVPVLCQLVQQHYDLIVAPGDAAIGGPRCAIILGRRDLVAAVIDTPVWPSIAADVATRASLVLTLEALTFGRGSEVPVFAMLDTAEENLRSRAERLATRVAAEGRITSCQITDRPATFSTSCPWSVPSRQLRLTHRDLSAADWAERLAGDVPAMLVSVDTDAIVVDLRWIQPSDDVSLVEKLVGYEMPAGQDESAPAGDQSEIDAADMAE